MMYVDVSAKELGAKPLARIMGYADAAREGYEVDRKLVT